MDGDTEDIMPLEPLREKYESFNWHVIECAGNDIPDIHRAFQEARMARQKPVCIIAHTIPGKGVSYMENSYVWHSQPFKPGQAEQALEELRTAEKKLKRDHAAKR